MAKSQTFVMEESLEIISLDAEEKSKMEAKEVDRREGQIKIIQLVIRTRVSEVENLVKERK